MTEPTQQLIAIFIMTAVSALVAYFIISFTMWNWDVSTWSNIDRFTLVGITAFLATRWKISVEE